MAKLSKQDALAALDMVEQLTARARELVEHDIRDDDTWWRTYLEEWRAITEYAQEMRHTLAVLSAEEDLAQTAAARKSGVHPATLNRWLSEGTIPVTELLRRWRTKTT